jgi:hypothetical protein
MTKNKYKPESAFYLALIHKQLIYNVIMGFYNFVFL